jgi:predicted TIM-barrel fold metal-dependent hydrolase
MIIDGHTHLCGEPHTQEQVVYHYVEGGTVALPVTRVEQKVDILLQDMDKQNVEQAVVMGLYDQISNEQLSELVKKHPKRIVGFAGVINPKNENSVPILRKAIKELGLKGLKLHPDIQSFSPADPEIIPLIKCAAEHNIPVYIHCLPGRVYLKGYFNLTTPGHIDTLKRRVPEATIIIGHFAYPRYLDLLTVGQAPGVYVETAGGLPSIVELNGKAFTVRLLRKIGVDKIIFGSDWSGGQFRIWQKDQINLIESLNLTREEKDKILGGNMKKVLTSKGTSYLDAPLVS